MIGENTITECVDVSGLSAKSGAVVQRRRSCRPTNDIYRLQILKRAKRLWTVGCEARLFCIRGVALYDCIVATYD